MASTPNAPGVYTDITDQTFQQSGIIQVSAAIVGPTPSGPPMVPTLVTSYDQYKSTFGTIFTSGSYYYEYLTSITAKNYFDNGGETLLVTRIVSGSGDTFKTYAKATVTSSGSVNPAFTLAVTGFGSVYNGTSTDFTRKWEIVNVDTQFGTFTVNIRQGNDTDTNKIILESYNNVSLDPQLPNYIARVVGDTVEYYNSVTGDVETEGSFDNNYTYTRVRSVDRILIDSLDSNGYLKSAYVQYLPQEGTSGSFAGGTDGVVFNGEHTFFEKITGTPTNVQGFTAEPYVDALELLSNRIEYNFDIIAIPGISPDNANMSTVVASFNALLQERQDAIGILDPVVYGSTRQAAKNAISSIDNKFIAAYWPWGKTQSLELGRNVMVPASVFIPGVFKFNDYAKAPWFAPAGFNRGGIPTYIKGEKKITQDDIAFLYAAGINPIATFPGNGSVIYAQNTLQKRLSHLRKVNVVRLVVHVKRLGENIAKNMLFDPNTVTAWTYFKNKINPQLEDIAQRQGLYAYRVIMDETNNTSDVIDRYELRGQLIIQPTITAEIIRLNITVAPTGVDISEQ